ncbi:MAG: HAD family hydrolase [Verrucomicrobiota bacterium]
MFRNLLLDWSGTLADDLPPVIEATNGVLRHFGQAELNREQFKARFQLPFARFYQEILPGVPMEELEPIFQDHFRASDQPVTILPQTLGFLEACRLRGRRLFILSSAHQEHLDEQVWALGLAAFFEKVYGSVRDKRERILHLLEDHDLDPQETAFIGDMQHDVETARHAGVRSIAVLTGYNSEAMLREAKPDHLFANLDGVLAWWTEQAGQDFLAKD